MARLFVFRRFLKLVVFLWAFIQAPTLFAQKTDSLSYLTLGIKQAGVEQEIVLINGQILREKDGIPIAGASIRILDQAIGAVSQEDGSFELSIPPGTYIAQISFIGSKPLQQGIKVVGPASWEIELEEAVLSLDEVLIEAQGAAQRLKEPNSSLVRMDARQLANQSKFLGEVDVLRSLQSISGVSSIGEGASGFHVRGGNADENLILQDQNLLMNPTHALGFFSLFHPDLVQSVELYKGGLPARYGGRLSSVLDVQLREGNKQKLSARGGLGLASSRLSLDGPIQKGKSSFIVGGRFSYLDYLLGMVSDVNIRKSEAFFYDLTAKADAQLGPNTKAGVSFFSSRDDFQFGDEVKIDYATLSGSAYLKHIIGESGLISLHLNSGQYQSALFDLEGVDQSRFANSVTYHRARLEGLFDLGQRQQINLGLEANLYQVLPGEIEPIGAESQILAQSMRQDQGLTMSAYLEDQINLGDRFSIMLGLRFTQYLHLGPTQVYLYDSSQYKSPVTVIDSLNVDAAKPSAQYYGLSPRISFKLDLSDHGSLKMGYYKTYQFISQISNTASAAPVDIWQLSNYHIQPQFSHNFSAGYFHLHQKIHAESSLSLFYRTVGQLIEYKDFAELLLNDHIETELLSGIGRAYGVELYFHNTRGKNQWEINYTWSRSFRQVQSTQTQPGINNGRWYPSNYDKPHVINATYLYKANQKNTIAVNFTYSSGRPTTAPISSYANANILNIPVYSDRNQFRIPAYHRMDFAYTLNPLKNKDRRWKSSWTISVYNVYARKNAFSVYFKQSPFQRVRAYRVAVLGSIFPSITYNFTY